MKTKVMAGLVSVLMMGVLVGVSHAEEGSFTEERSQMRAEGKAAREAEMKLRQQAREAYEAGDIEKAKEIRSQVKEMHQSNVAAFKQKREAMKEKFGEMREERQENRQENRQERREDRQGDRQENREERQEKRQDRRENRQENRQERREDRRENVSERHEKRQENRQERRQENNRSGGGHEGRQRK